MKEKIAKENLNGGDGIGFDTAVAQEYAALSKKYKVEDLDGRWAVDVLKIIKGLPPVEFHYKDYIVAIDTVVLEEVCHTAGYAHHEREDLDSVTDFFFDLALESYEYSTSDKAI